jgi:hypothetical protein
MVKAGYLDNSTPVHKFAKTFLEILGRMKENEAKEKFQSQVSRKITEL